jgi:Holliday junction resolvase RusA-like endonuclease
MEAVGDMLQAADIIRDDRQICAWDGSRRMLDGAEPRVEIYITILEEIPVQEKLYVESDARD